MNIAYMEIILHYYWSPLEFNDLSAPVTKEGFKFLVHNGLLKEKDGCPKYEITPRGRAYVDALKAVKLPVAVWASPADPRVAFDGETHRLREEKRE